MAMKSWVRFETEGEEEQVTVSTRSLLAVIKRRGIKPDKDGNWRITDEIVAEAKALDEAANVPGLSPEDLKALEDAMSGKPSDWERWDLDEDSEAAFGPLLKKTN